jgi:hypothetical protein
MANDSSLLPSVAAAPGTATQGGTVNPFNYSAHLDRLVLALDQLSVSLAFIADKIDNMSDKLGDIATQSSIIATQNSIIATQSSIIATAATGTGIRTKGPQDWIGLVSTYKLYVEDTGAIGLIALTGYKAKIDALPKDF